MNVFVFEYFTAITPATRSIGEEGRAMRDAVAEDFRAIPGVTVTTLEPAAGSSIPLMQRFADQCALADVVIVVAPEMNGLLEDFAKVARRLCDRVLNAAYALIQLASDKNRTATMFQQLGVPSPSTIAKFSPELLPMIVKPIHGAGGLEIRRIESVEEWEAFARSEPRDFRVEPFVVGTPASVSLICHDTQVTTLPPVLQHFREGTFEFTGGELIRDSRLVDRVVSLVNPLVPLLTGSYGWVGIDLVLGENEMGDDDVVIEVNPRLTSSYLVLRANQCGDGNLAEAMLFDPTHFSGVQS